MNKLDQLISHQNKLEAKKDRLLKELSSVEDELKSVKKVRHEAEKIYSRVQRHQAKMDSLLEEQIPKRKRKKSQQKEDDFVADLPQNHEEDRLVQPEIMPQEEGGIYEESYQDV